MVRIDDGESLAWNAVVWPFSWAQVKQLPGKKYAVLTHPLGGHTSEALALVSALDFSRYTPRTYLISEGDNLSLQKATLLELSKSVDSVALTVCYLI